MKPLYTKILTLNYDAERLSASFKSMLWKWAEANNVNEYNPIELAHLLNEELALMLCGNYCDISEDLQTNTTVREAYVIDELADAVKNVIDDSESLNGKHWPDVIKQCKAAFEKKQKLDKGDY